MWSSTALAAQGAPLTLAETRQNWLERQDELSRVPIQGNAGYFRFFTDAFFGDILRDTLYE